MRILFFYRGVESLGVGYLMSMLKSRGHTVDLIFDPGIDDNLFLKAPALRWMNRREALLERARAFQPDLVAVSILTNILWQRWLVERELGLNPHRFKYSIDDLVVVAELACVGDGSKNP